MKAYGLSRHTRHGGMAGRTFAVFKADTLNAAIEQAIARDEAKGETVVRIDELREGRLSQVWPEGGAMKEQQEQSK